MRKIAIQMDESPKFCYSLMRKLKGFKDKFVVQGEQANTSPKHKKEMLGQFYSKTIRLIRVKRKKLREKASATALKLLKAVKDYHNASSIDDDEDDGGDGGGESTQQEGGRRRGGRRGIGGESTQQESSSAARRSAREALQIEVRAGGFSALVVVGIAVIGVTILYATFYVFLGVGSPGPMKVIDLPLLLVGYGFGASFVALFAQVGGGIYTKAADVGADLVGKVEQGIPEDDPRNPAVIADLVPVPTLKDQIATVTGILSERQRLICRGRVLKDNQLLSAYHVEDGHTLHLVVRDPIPPSQSTNDRGAPDYPSSAADAQGAPGGPRVVVGTFNIPDQGQGGLPDMSQILSGFLGSLGALYDRNGNPSDSASELPTYTIHRTTSSGFGFTESARRQPIQVSGSSQINPSGIESQQPPSGGPQQPMHPPVIPDSLTTLSQYLNHVAVEFAIVNGEEEISPLLGAPIIGSNVPMPEFSRVSLSRGLPRPETLDEVLQSTRQLLINQTAESLNRLAIATQLQNQANVTDESARMSIQSNAMRSGIFLRDMGALLLELGRTTMLLRMGENTADAIVNAGSAVFVNESGPNLIMVQPFPLGSLHSGVGFDASFVPRNFDIRIQTGVQQSWEPISQATTETPPIASHSEPGMVFPVMAGVQTTSNNATDIRGSAASGHVSGQPRGGMRPAAAQYTGNLL